MIIFILLILLIIGLIVFYVYKTGLLKKDHLKEIQDLLEEINARDKTISDHKKTIKSKKNKLEKESEEITNLNQELKELKDKLSSTIIEKNSRIADLEIQLEIKDNLLIKESKKLKEKENNRIASVGTISSKQRKINNLERELIELKENHKQELFIKDKAIRFWKEKCKQPDVEEVKAYDFQQKEVEKRAKKGIKHE